jgi:uncharacterized protein YcgI (DUF1989 family)
MYDCILDRCSKIENQSPQNQHSKMNQHLRLGNSMLSFAWFQVATKIVDKAIRIYDLDEEQAAALRKVFLRPNDYVVS